MAVERSPVGEVLSDSSFRTFWAAQFLAQLVAGSLRFTFVWLALLLTDWPRAAGLVSLAVGLPALLLSLPAGTWSDRTDRRRLMVVGTAAMGVVLACTAWLSAASRLDLVGAALLAGAVSVAHAFVTPAQQAVVPSLVPAARLSTAVGLVTVSMQIAFFLGAVVNGAAIRLLGISGAFGVMAVLCGASALAMSRVEVPPARSEDDEAPRGLIEEAREGLAFVARTEPLRSLVLAGMVIGLLWGVIQINLPVLAKESMGRSALGASLLVGAFTPGSLLSSLWVATRRELVRPGLLFALALGLGLGPGAIVIGMSGSYTLTLCAMAVWGLFGGIAMTTQRTMVQSRTPSLLMGRVMGIWTLAMVGGFPVAAGISAALAPRLGPGGTMLTVAIVTTVVAPLLVFRRPVREG